MIEQSEDFEIAANLNLYFNDNYRLLKYSEKANEVVYISYTQKGNAITAHIAALNTQSKRLLRRAVREATKTFFTVYDWCEVILVAIDKVSVYNLLKKSNFKLLKTYQIKNKIIRVMGVCRYE